MAKQGMKRPARTHSHRCHDATAGAVRQGKAMPGKSKANPIISGTVPPSQKVFHAHPHTAEKPISDIYSVIDNDLARDNLENDIPEPDLP